MPFKTRHCLRRQPALCAMCQADTALGVNFRLDNNLTEIPACPFTGQVGLPPPPKPYSTLRLPDSIGSSAPTTVGATIPKFLLFKRKLPSIVYSETLASIPQDVKDYLLDHSLSDYLTANELPPINCSCDANSTLRRLAINKGWVPRRTLLVGNHDAPFPSELDLNLFDEIIVFNECYHLKPLQYATLHVLRPVMGHQHLSGYQLVKEHKAPVLIIDGGELIAPFRATHSGRTVYTRSARAGSPDYPPDKVPSTGFTVIKMCQERGDDILLTNFTWQGTSGHAWDFEREYCASIPRTEYTPPPLTKLGHFVWLNYDVDGQPKILSGAEYMSVRTFMHHHPDWTVKLHTNCAFPSTPLHDDLLSRGLIIEPVSISIIPKHIGLKFKVGRSDWYKLYMLYNQGGAALDLCDTTTIANMDSMLLAANKIAGGEDKLNRHYHSGLLMVNRPGDEALYRMVQWFETKYYQAATVRVPHEHEMLDLFRKQPRFFSKRWPFQVAYPVPYTEIDAHLTNNTYEIFPETVQFHWYTAADGGISRTMTRLNALNQFKVENLETDQSGYAKLVRLALGVPS